MECFTSVSEARMKTRDLSTCFLFANHLDADGCLSIRLNAQGEEEYPLTKRTISEIAQLQAQAKTIVVLPTASASLHLLTLPWLSERKAREAIPFALEEVIAQPVAEVHFAFDKAHYINGRYLVVAIDAALLSQCIGLLDELDIDFDALTLDWFALKPGEVFIGEDRFLIAADDFKGALSPELAQRYLNTSNSSFRGFLFNNSLVQVDASEWVRTKENMECFVAKRLISASFINLCQGDFRHNTHRETNTRWYALSAALFSLWLVSILSTNALVLHKLKLEDALVQEEIASIYRLFFPEAREVISPRFRVEQALKDEAGGKKGDVWYILGPIVKAIDDTEGVRIEQWSYQNQVMTLHLVAKNFAALESFEKNLNKLQIKVKQNSAGSAEKGEVTAVLELEA